MATRPIDEKIVVMKLDNSDFTRKAAETTSLFGKLRDSINRVNTVNLSNTTRELNTISHEANSINLNGLVNQLQNISSRFTTLGVVATTALVNIANRAVNAGVTLAKSFTLDPVMDGFGEYETKIKAIGTVLSNTQWAGTKLKDVNVALADLNTYADKTIYNFGQMTENIGRFTAAGVRLGDATVAIKGLSNLAAASGSTSDQLNSAMYQMSQSLASGKLTLMDWNSLVNAGMGGKKTQDALLATAKAMGKNVKMTNGFRDSIQSGWLTSEVLLKTLKKFGADKSMIDAATKVRTFTSFIDTLKESIGSGWATTWETLIGNFDGATNLWTKASVAIGNVVNNSAKARNALATDFVKLGGRDSAIASVSNLFNGLGSILKVVRASFADVFPPITAQQLVNTVKTFEKFTEKLKLSEDGAKKLGTVFNGVFSVFGTVLTIAKVIGKTLLDIVPDNLGHNIINLVLNLSKLSTSFRESVQAGNGFTTFIQTLGKVIKSTLTIIGNIFTSIGSVVIAAFKGILKVGDKLMPFFNAFGDALSKIAGGVKVEDIVSAGFIGAVILAAKSLKNLSNNVTGVFDTVSETIKGIGKGFGDIKDTIKNLGGITDALETLTTGVRVFTLLQIAVSLGILAVSMRMIADLPAQDIFKSLEVLGLALAGMTWALLAISKFDFAGTGTFGASVLILAVANAVLVLSVALKMMSTIDPQRLSASLMALVVTVGTIVGAITLLSKFSGKIKTSSVSLIALSTSIVILASALKIMSTIETSDLIKAVTTMTVLFAELAIFIKALTGSKLNVGTAIAINLISTAILGIVASIGLLGKMDVSTLVKGLTTITLILGVIAGFSALVSGGGMIAASISMNLIAVALNMLLIPMKVLGSMSLESLGKGLGALAIVLGEIVGALALADVGVVGAAAIVMVAMAIDLLVPPLLALSKLSLKEVGIGLLALAGTFTVVGLAAAVLGTVGALPLVVFAASLLAVGIAVGGVGIVLIGLATILTTLAGLTVAGVASIVGAFDILLMGLLDAIPNIIKVVVTFIVELTKGFAKAGPAMVENILYGLVGILTAIRDHVPQVVAVVIQLVTALINALANNLPALIEAGANLIVKFIQGMANAIHDHKSDLINAVLDLMASILEIVTEALVALVNVLFGWIPGVSKAAGKIGKGAEDAIDKYFDAAHVGKTKGSDFANNLNSKAGEATAAGSNVGNAGRAGASSVDLKSVGMNKGAEFVSALASKTGSATASGKSLAEGGKSGAGSIDLTSTGANFGDGFANGISSKLGSVISAAKSLAKAAEDKIKSWLDIHSPSRVTTKLGEHTGQGFANGISKKKAAAERAAREAAAAAKKGFNDAMDKADYKFKMGQINSTQYIAEIEKIKKAYAKYPDLVRDANLKIKKAEDDAAKHKADLLKQQAEAEKKSIDDGKYYNQLSLTQELAAWQSVMNKYKKGTQERADAEREVYRVKNEINQKLLDLNEEYTSKISDANQKLIDGEKELNDAYNNAVADRTKTLTGFAGLFDQISHKSDVTGQSLINNLQDQVSTFAQWGSNIQSLANKGINQGLLKDLKEMGPQAADEVAALNTLTSDQLDQYVVLWQEKNQLAHDEAVTELDGMKQDTATKIDELRAQTATQLETYKNEWLAKIKEISTGTPNQFVGLNASMSDIGKNAIKGLMSGMDNMTPSLMAQANAIANSVASTIKKALKIHSPSRVLMGLGEYAGEGLAIGISNKVKRVGDSAKSLALTAKDSVNKFLDGFDPAPEDNEIHFKAVVDYETLDPSKFGRIRPMVVAPDTSFATNTIFATRATNNQNNDINRSVRDAGKSVESKSTVIEQNLNFYSKELTPSEVARKNLQASRQLAMQWGV